MKHLKAFDKTLFRLEGENESCHKRIDHRREEMVSLKKRVLDLETRNVLLEAKVTRFSLSVKREETDHR